MHSVTAQPAMGYHGLQWLCFKPIAGLLLDAQQQGEAWAPDVALRDEALYLRWGMRTSQA
jgi:hypothetical protein